MKIRWFDVISCVAVLLAAMSGCDNASQVPKEEINQTVQKQKPEAEAVRSFDFAIVDTLMVGDAVFVSEPIPFEIQERMKDVSLPQDARIDISDLRYLTLPYYDFEGQVQQGEMVCNVKIAKDLIAVFRELFEKQYQFCSIRLIDDFGGSDEASMLANNTSCFNYRTKSGSSALSSHALGLAVDVNPMQNPFVKRGKVYPETATDFVDRNLDFAHKIDTQDACYKSFKAHGFRWGGLWRSAKDYQHFEKK
ncbi:MAG: M15 family metallopeptidase [Bacteroidales bacterium]|nr:M15 family metallopeptidase [Bacteroidales bacterium]